MKQSTIKEDVEAVRAFNRQYSTVFGFLNERLNGSAFLLAEARTLYEIAHGDGLTAADIHRKLGIDKAQISRITSKFQTDDLITATPCADHAKRQTLTLTPAGREAFEALDQATETAVAGLLTTMSPRDRVQMRQSMEAVTRLLKQDAGQTPAYILRDPRPGDLGWILHAQTRLYAEEYGWDWTYESLMARILADFIDTFDPQRERAWIAEMADQIVGAIFLMQGPTPEAAKLRLLHVEAQARGLGLGSTLVDACVAQARAFGYQQLELWTNDVLRSARRIYEAAGFVLVKEEAHHSFGKDLVGQTWRLNLVP